MLKLLYKYIVLILLLVGVFDMTANAQLPRGLPRLPRGGGGGGAGGGGGDSLKRRDNSEDSITINFRYLDSTRNYTFDSSLSDFTVRYPIPATHMYLGNTGTATRSLLFSPLMKAGWDPGFHAFDAYKWKAENVRFYNTTRPYTELGYLLGSKEQQIIEILHTQNVKPYWNVAVQYRLINSAGFFTNQKTNHNNYLFSSWYQSPKKRYNNYVIVLSNQLQAAENGGIETKYLDSVNYVDRNLVPARLGSTADNNSSFFSNKLSTGNRYKELNIIMRQQYDLGQKDSIVTDSTVIPLFYPRLRFEHTLKFGKYDYRFLDYGATAVIDTSFYQKYYDTTGTSDSISFRDTWREISNDFSIYQFPDAKNLHQFIKLGLESQILKGEFDSGRRSESLYNFIAHGEYRNRTKNQKWDIQTWGRLFLNGSNAGDYHAYISLQRLLSKNIGTLQLGFENVNRSPSFIFNTQSSFYLDNPKSFSKENTLHFFGNALVPKLKLQLGADYYFVSNYMYFTEYYKAQQDNAIFNLLRIHASKIFSLNRRWRLYSDVWLQQKAGNAQVNVPLFYTRNRLAFEGTFFKNLNLSTGLEVRYHSPYKADNYSPVLGQFFYQDATTISNLPEVSAFMHFRIRSFKGFVRAENLNTARYWEGGFNFTNNNLAAPDYAYPGLVIRFGFYWSFVN